MISNDNNGAYSNPQEHFNILVPSTGPHHGFLRKGHDLVDESTLQQLLAMSRAYGEDTLPLTTQDILRRELPWETCGKTFQMPRSLCCVIEFVAIQAIHLRGNMISC